MKSVALIVAAGSGKRMNADKPKQFIDVFNKPLLVYTVEVFNTCDELDRIIIATNKEYIDEVKYFVNKYHLNKVVDVVMGGDTRQQSVYLGLQAIKHHYPNDKIIVLIHDGARPLINQQLISESIKLCNEYNAVTLAINATDSIVKSVDGKSINQYLNRKEIIQIQTPQTFDLDLILKAHQEALINNINDALDDASLVLELLRKNVYLLNGNKLNFKVTTNEDLELFQALIKLK